MTLPTKNEVYERLQYHLRKAQEESATLAHLNNADGDAPGAILAKGWLNVSESFKLTQQIVMQLQQGNRKVLQ